MRKEQMEAGRMLGQTHKSSRHVRIYVLCVCVCVCL